MLFLNIAALIASASVLALPLILYSFCPILASFILLKALAKEDSSRTMTEESRIEAIQGEG